MERSRFGGSDTLQATLPSGHDHDGTPVAPYIYAVQASGGRCNGHSVSERPPP